MDIDIRAPRGQLFRGGRWRSAADIAAVEDPATEQAFAEVGWGDADDVDAAVADALAGATEWAGQPWTDRAAALRELAGRVRADAERLARIDSAESGNPLRASLADVAQGAKALEYFAGLGGACTGQTLPTADTTLAFTVRRPYAVVGRILAYNHPLMFAIQGSAAPLIAGTSLVLKPADPTPVSALEFAALTHDLLPPGVLNVVPGDGPVAGHALAAHPQVPRIAFTGSVATGRRVLGAGVEYIKRVSLELGGKNPLLVLADADVGVAADTVVRGMNLTSTGGQSCMSTSRVLVHTSLHDQLVEECAARFRALRVGPPHLPDTDVGAMGFRDHYERVLAHIQRGVDEGARLVVGGGRPAELERGHFIEPTLFDQVSPDMGLARDEIFGPVVAVLRCSSDEEIVRLANASAYGLTANVLTADLAGALGLVRSLEAGLLWVNGPTPRPPGLPFGGVKHSGLGRDHGLEELLSYTEEQSVLLAPPGGTVDPVP